MVQPKYHVFICTSCRINGDVVINNTGCFGICDKGPVVVVYPEGVWYGNVSEDDVERIVEEHFEGGVPVDDLMI